jgi:hypothetical protein
MTWTMKYLGHWRLFNDLSGVNDGHAMGQLCDHAEVVRDQKDCEPTLLSQSQKQVDDLGLNADIKCRGRFIGNQQRRSADQGCGKEGALAHAAAELMGILACPAAWIGNTDLIEGGDGPLPDRTAFQILMGAQGLGNLLTNRPKWVQRRQRILEDDADVLAANGTHFPLRKPVELATAQGNAIGFQACCRGQQPKYR